MRHVCKILIQKPERKIAWLRCALKCGIFRVIKKKKEGNSPLDPKYATGTKTYHLKEPGFFSFVSLFSEILANNKSSIAHFFGEPP
jgi:hypothetical protein